MDKTIQTPQSTEPAAGITPQPLTATDPLVGGAERDVGGAVPYDSSDTERKKRRWKITLTNRREVV